MLRQVYVFLNPADVDVVDRISKDWADHILTVLYEFWMNIWLMFGCWLGIQSVGHVRGRNRNGVLSVFNLCCKVKFSVRNYWDQFSPARLHLNTVQFMTQALCYWFLNPFSQTHSARTLFLLAWKYWKLCVRLEPYYAVRIYTWTYEESLKFTVLPCYSCCVYL